MWNQLRTETGFSDPKSLFPLQWCRVPARLPVLQATGHQLWFTSCLQKSKYILWKYGLYILGLKLHFHNAQNETYFCWKLAVLATRKHSATPDAWFLQFYYPLWLAYLLLPSFFGSESLILSIILICLYMSFNIICYKSFLERREEYTNKHGTNLQVMYLQGFGHFHR